MADISSYGRSFPENSADGRSYWQILMHRGRCSSVIGLCVGWDGCMFSGHGEHGWISIFFFLITHIPSEISTLAEGLHESMMKRQDWPLCKASQFGAGLPWLVELLTLGQGEGVTGKATGREVFFTLLSPAERAWDWGTEGCLVLILPVPRCESVVVY